MDFSYPVKNEAFVTAYAQTKRFTCGAPRNFQIAPHPASSHILFLRSHTGTDATLCLWKLDTQTGKEHLLFDPQTYKTNNTELTEAEKAKRERFRENATGITAYTTDATAQHVCFLLHGSIFVLDLQTETTHNLSNIHNLPDNIFDPRISPDGEKIAYVAGNDLHYLHKEGATWATYTSSSVFLSTDPQIHFGKAEFIAAEEMRRTRGYWWSPGSDAILATQVDETAVATWWISNPADPTQKPRNVSYPAAGTTNATVKLFHFKLHTAAKQEVLWNKDEEDTDYEYLCAVKWTQEKPCISRQTRDQKILNHAIVTLKPTSPEKENQPILCRTVKKITDKFWTELIPSSPKQTKEKFITLEDTEEKRVLSVDTKIIDLENIQLSAIHAVSSEAVLVSGAENPAEKHFYWINIETGEYKQLTETPGVHTVLVGGTVAVHTTYIDIHSVPIIRVMDIDVTDKTFTQKNNQHGEPIQIQHRSQKPPLVAKPIFHQITDQEIQSAILLPDDHDGATPLPVILDPYGGPHAQRVRKMHNMHLVSQWFANQGYAVIVTDGRGTPGKGPQWERAVWGDLATPVLDDQLYALDKLSQIYPFLNLESVGIRGWSFGGYLAALAVLRRPDRFHAAVAGAPVTDWRLYDTHYTERYLGHPDIYKKHYEDTDLSNNAALNNPMLQRPLLLLHGLADDNVVSAHTFKLSSALLNGRSNHAVIPLSNVTHMTPQQKTTENLLRIQVDFFKKNLH